MAEQAAVIVTGIKEIREKLSPERLRVVLQEAIAEAVAPIVTEARALAPRKTGRMAGSIRAVIGRRGGAATTATILSGAGYAHLVEYGHRIVVGGRIARQGAFVPLSRRGRFQGQVIGTVAPHPFVRPAFVAHEQEMTRIIGERIAEAINAP